MRRALVAIACLLSLAFASSASAAAPVPPFHQCPAVGSDTSCGILIRIDPARQAGVYGDPTQGPYDNVEDTLVGVQNDSSRSISSLPLSATTGKALFGFDADGLCAMSNAPSGCPFGPTGYEGPGTSFSDISANKTSGTVHFSPAIPPGGHAYFSLEEALSTVPPFDFAPGPPTGGGPSPSPSPSPSPGPIQTVPPAKVPVVLVGGLDTDTPLVTPSTPCGDRKLKQSPDFQFKKLCKALAHSGHPVYSIPESKGGGPREFELDTGGAIGPNARKLAKFIDTRLKGRPPPLIVGHSMGGLIGRVAISRYGVRARGLFTIGSPHDGSFAADAIEGARTWPCGHSPASLARCAAIRGVGERAERHFGSGAIKDLTREARGLDNLSLRRPGVETWVYAGTVIPGRGTGYFFPNDDYVGKSSAFGALANLGFPESYYRTIRHSAEPSDPDVISKVVKAANSSSIDHLASRATTRSRTALSGATISRRRPKSRRRRKLVFSLATGIATRVSPGRPLAPGASSAVVAHHAFKFFCRDKRVSGGGGGAGGLVGRGGGGRGGGGGIGGGGVVGVALPAFGSGLYAAFPTQMGCSRATLLGSRPIHLLVGDTRARVRATATVRGKALRIAVRARGRLRRAYLTSGRRRLRAKVLSRSRHRIVLSIPLRRLTSKTKLTARVRGRRYAGVLPRGR